MTKEAMEFSSSGRDQRLERVLIAYVEAMEQGQKLSPQDWQARYPEFAAELAEFCADRERIESFAKPLRALSPKPPQWADRGADNATIGLAESVSAKPQGNTTARYFGDYELLEEIGRGGMGVVYKARQVSLNRVVALKMILAGQLADDADVRRFHAEAEAAARLDHPGIVPVYEVGRHDELHYFAMAYVDGESLAHKIVLGVLPPRQAAELTKKLTEAVAYAHIEGVIHRDLKPANILIDRNGQPRLTDFGLAKRLSSDPGASANAGLTVTGQILGTPSYMPPEQASGQGGAVGPQSDVYSLGAILYCMLTGRPPFQSDNPLDTLMQVVQQEPAPPRQLNAAVPRDLETICLKCLAKELRKRYASAQELGADLDRFLAGQPIQARPIGAVGRAWRWCRRKPALATASALTATALAATVVMAVFFALYQADAAANTRSMLAESYLEKGQGLCEQGDITRGTLWLARSLETVPAGAPELERAIRRNLGAWSRPAAGLKMSKRLQNGCSVVAFSSDGKTIMTEEGTLTALLWEAATMKPIGKLDHRKDATGNVPSVTVALSPDGKTIATECYDPVPGTVARLWDVETGAEIRRFKIPSLGPDGNPFFDQNSLAAATTLGFSRDGKTLMTCDGRNVQLWDVATGNPQGPTIRCMEKMGGVHKDWVGAALSPDGKTIVTGGRDNIAQLWDAAIGKPLGAPLEHGSLVHALAFSADGKTLLTGSYDGNARLWEVATGKLIGKPLPHGAFVVTAAFSPDGTRVVTGGGNFLQHWEVRTQQPIGEPLRHWHAVYSVAYSPDGRTVLTGASDSTARLWDVPVSKPGDILLPHDAPVLAAAFGPDGRFVATCCFADKHGRTAADLAPVSVVQFWNAVTGKPLGEPLPPQSHQETPLQIAFSSDGKTFALLSEYWSFQLSRQASSIQLWDVATRRPIGQPLEQRVDGHSRWGRGIERLAFAADGKTLTATDMQGLIQVWDWTTGQPIGEPQKSQSDRPEALSSDGKRSLTGRGEDNTAVLRDVVKGQDSGIVQHQGAVMAVAISSDTALLLTGSDDNTARLWDAATRKPIGPPLKHDGPVRAVAFSPDGKTILSASLDKTTRLRSVPLIVEGDIKRVALWPQVATGTQLNDPALQVMDGDEWLRRKQRLDALGGPPMP